ncbi:MAG: pilus assembly protein, partial [Gammaproteobacteria bacterium]
MPQTLDPFQNNPTWPTSFVDRHPSAIDDLWHATINSRGLMLEAKRPSEIADTLGAVLQDIQGRAGSASSIALNSTSLRAGSSVYQARFDSTDWSGQLLSIPILSDGTLGTADWDAALKLAGQDYDTGRKIVTFKPLARTGARFRWASLEPAQTVELEKNPSTSLPDGLGSQRLDYLRGKDVAGMRLRAKKLGDIVHSSPAFVGAPIYRYPDRWPDTGARAAPENAAPYSMFKSSNSTRKPLVYAGANDGMLHAFDADPTAGEEVFAYVPAAVYKNLNQLTNPTYAHRFFVDGAPTVGDAFFGGSWHTVLVGGLRAGGQAIYALDITDPPGDETAAAAKVLWEFNDVEGLLPSDPDYGDKDLGDTFSEPNIVRLHNGEWAAVFGNGYNNTENDPLQPQPFSTTGNAVLYIVNIETGELIKKIDTGVGKAQDPKNVTPANQLPNGLATPAPIDTNGDSIVDYIYAGDLFGNLWKFDVSSADKNLWQVLGPSGGPLFVACAGTGTQCTTAGASNLRQPITTRPQVGRHPTKAEG